MCDEPAYFDSDEQIKLLEQERLKKHHNVLKKTISTSLSLLKNQINLLKTIFANSTDLIALKDEKFVYQTVNPSFCRFLGKTEDEIIGKTDFDLFPSSEAKLLYKEDKAVFENHEPLIQDEKITGSEEARWLHIVKTPVLNEDGDTKGILCSIRDLTERRNAKRELQKSEEKYRSFYKNLPVPYQSLDINGIFLDVNPAWLKVLGYDINEVIGREFTDFVAPGYSEQFKKNFPKFLAVGEINNVHFKLIKKSGEYISVEYFGKAGYDENGDFLRTHCIFHDISDRARMEQEREQLVSELKKSIENSKTLSSLLPICSSCKKIRDDQGYWNQIEMYITEHTGTLFSHSVCPDCVEKLYPDFKKIKKDLEDDDDEE